MTRDHNLLFGVFAVQLGKVTPVQLMDAAAAWATDTSRDIPSRLVALGILAEPDRQLLQRFVDEAVAAHGGNAERTLANFGGEEQVHRTFRGSIVLSADGMVSIPPTQQTLGMERVESGLAVDAHSVKGVFETPGRYTELREYARGGMGRVLLVHDDSLGREIALKELLPHLGEAEHQSTLDADAGPGGMHPSPVRFSAHILARFLQEARITGQLEHPSIVPVYELGHRRDGSLYYTMKLVRGRSLSKALKVCKNLEERLCYLPHFVDLCQAIAYAHSRKIIHRDIKPANVMVGEFGETVVLDWGLAKKRDREDVHEREIAETIHAMNLGDEVAAAKTGYGQILGTPVYMAPEQARGDLAEVDEQSDVYSLGVVLYEILTGKVPFDGKSTRDVLKQVIGGDRIPVELLEREAPPELAAIAYKAMRKEKAGRYRDVKALAEEAMRFQSGALVKAHRYNLAGYTRFVWRRYRALITIGAAAAAILTVSTSVYVFQLIHARNVIESQNAELIQTNAALARQRDEADGARVKEAAARQLAEVNRLEAEKQRTESETRKGQIEIANRQLALENYSYAVGAASKLIDEGSNDRAREILYSLPPEFRGWEWGYLARAEEPSYFFFSEMDLSESGAGGGIQSLRISPDNRYLYCRYWTSYSHVYDLKSASAAWETQRLEAHQWTTRFTPDSKYISFSESQREVALYHAASAEPAVRFSVTEGLITSIVFSADNQRAAAMVEHNSACEVAWFSMEGGAPVSTVQAGLKPTLSDLDSKQLNAYTRPHASSVLGFLPDNLTVVFETDKLGLASPSGSEVAFVADCPHLASYAIEACTAAVQSAGLEYELWDLQSRTMLGRSAAQPPGYLGRDGMEISPDGRWLWTPHCIYSITNGEFVLEDRPWVEKVSAGEWLRNSRGMVGHRRQNRFVFSFESHNRAAIHGGFLKDSEGASFSPSFVYWLRKNADISPDGQLLAYLDSKSNEIIQWSLQTRFPRWRRGLASGPHGDAPLQVKYSPDGSLIAANLLNSVEVYSADNAEHKITIGAPSGTSIHDIAISYENSEIALGLRGEVGDEPCRFNLSSGAPIEGPGVGSRDFSGWFVEYVPDRRRLFWGTHEGGNEGLPLKVLDLDSGTVGDVEASRGMVRIGDAAFSPTDGTALLLGKSGCTMFDLETGAIFWRISLTGIKAMFSRDGARVFISTDSMTHVCSASDGRSLLSIPNTGWPSAIRTGDQTLIGFKHNWHMKEDKNGVIASDSVIQFRQVDEWAILDRKAEFQKRFHELQVALGLTQHGPPSR